MAGIFEEQFDAAVQAKLNMGGGAAETRAVDGTIAAADAGKTLYVADAGTAVLTFDAGLPEGFEITVVAGLAANVTVQPASGQQMSNPSGTLLGVDTPIGSANISSGGASVVSAVAWKLVGTRWLAVAGYSWGPITPAALPYDWYLGQFDQAYQNDAQIDLDPAGGTTLSNVLLRTNNPGQVIDFADGLYRVLLDGVVLIDFDQVVPATPYTDPTSGIVINNFDMSPVGGQQGAHHFDMSWLTANNPSSVFLVVQNASLDTILSNNVAVATPTPPFANDLAVNFSPGVADDVGAWYHTQNNVLGGVPVSAASLAISLWVKSPNDGNSGTGLEPFWMGQWKVGGINDWKLDAYETGGESRLRFHVIDPADVGLVTKYYTVLSGLGIQNALWHHLLLIYDHATTVLPRLYIDGVLPGDWTDDGSSGGGATAVRVGSGSTGFTVGSMVDGALETPPLSSGTAATFLSEFDLPATVDLSTTPNCYLVIDGVDPGTIDLSSQAGNPAAVTPTEIVAAINAAFPGKASVEGLRIRIIGTDIGGQVRFNGPGANNADAIVFFTSPGPYPIEFNGTDPAPTKQYGGEFDEVAIWLDTGQDLAAAGPLGWLAGGVRDLNNAEQYPLGMSAPKHWWRFGDDVVTPGSIGGQVDPADLLPNLGTAGGAITALVPGDATPVQEYSSGPTVATG